MTGKFVSEDIHKSNDAHGRWYLELMDPTTQEKNRIYYHDIRNFGTLKFCLSRAELEDKLQTLGPDILKLETTSEDTFLEMWSGKNPSLNVCKFLMNQSVSS